MSKDPQRDDLPRGRALDAAWRAASRDEPAPALDAAILAAARRAVVAGPQLVREATRPQRPWWPLAAAASIGAVAFGILQLLGPENAVAPGAERAVVTDVPRASVAPAAPMEARERRDAPSAMKDSAPSPSRASEAASNTAKVLRQQAPAETRQVPAPAADDAMRPMPASPARDAAASAGAARAFPATPTPAAAPSPPAPSASALGKLEAPPAPAPAPALAPAPRAAAPASSFVAEPPAAASGTTMRADSVRKAAAPPAVEEWLARIRKLRDEGRTEDLAREVAAFRAAYPNEETRLNEALGLAESPRRN